MPVFKSLFNRASNIFNGNLEENIFFLHIPKCGGSSISYAISWRYLTLDIRKGNGLVSLDPAAASNVIRITDQIDYPHNTTDDYPVLEFREKLLLYFMNRKKARYISGHFTFSEAAYREFGDQYAFVTILRDPAQRWISSYFYNRYKKTGHMKVEADITTYLQSEFGRSQGYECVKFLGGADKAGDYTSKQAIDRAKKNLHKFDVVGCLEYQESFLTQFECRFGVRLRLEKRNQSPTSKSHRNSIITENIKEKIKAVCRPDYEIYQYVVDNFCI